VNDGIVSANKIRGNICVMKAMTEIAEWTVRQCETRMSEHYVPSESVDISDLNFGTSDSTSFSSFS
jgi:hypothetical protein